MKILLINFHSKFHSRTKSSNNLIFNGTKQYVINKCRNYSIAKYIKIFILSSNFLKLIVM